MSALAITALSLGKRYFLRTRREQTALAALESWFGLGESRRELWALRGIDLAIEQGEFVGLIGTNGAGKTTLLKLLAGLIPPSEGAVNVRGAISPFFRVGSGLYTELTVLDNVRLTGALLGLSRREIEARIPAIAAFGEFEPYLEAKLGELSSGYQSRVVFSTALHSAVEVLLFDEVFAVGDGAFARKCKQRFDELRCEGRTIVLASHNLNAMRSYCSRVVYLDRGHAALIGSPQEATSAYATSQGLPASG